MKQTSLFGFETNIEDIVTKKTLSKLTKIEKHYNKYGYNENEKCKTCDKLVRTSYNGKNYYKCKIIGFSHSKATDIKVRNQVACSQYNKGDK